jgi:hypothetical protein
MNTDNLSGFSALIFGMLFAGFVAFNGSATGQETELPSEQIEPNQKATSYTSDTMATNTMEGKDNNYVEYIDDIRVTDGSLPLVEIAKTDDTDTYGFQFEIFSDTIYLRPQQSFSNTGFPIRYDFNTNKWYIASFEIGSTGSLTIDGSVTKEGTGSIFINGGNMFFDGGTLWMQNKTVKKAQGYELEERSDTPAPGTGFSEKWLCDGSASLSCDRGDVMLTINNGSSTKTTTLVDFSSI